MVSLHHAFMFLLLYSSVSLPFCSSIYPHPCLHQFPLSLFLICVCCQSLSLIILYFFLFITNFSVSQSCIFLFTCFFFFTSLRVEIVLFWSKICPIWFPVVGMNLGKLLNFPSPQFPHLYDEGVGPSRK